MRRFISALALAVAVAFSANTAMAAPTPKKASMTAEQAREFCIQNPGGEPRGIKDAHGNWLGWRKDLTAIADCMRQKGF
jgi:hypothetical protein